MQVGTTKDQGLYNKPSAAVHPGALAAGTLPQYNTRHKKSLEKDKILSCNSGVKEIFASLGLNQKFSSVSLTNSKRKPQTHGVSLTME